jgi:hypothetical protein
MWSAPDGHRNLPQTETKLLCESIDSILDTIQFRAAVVREKQSCHAQTGVEQECFETGIELFDALEVGEQLAVMHDVSLSLSNKKDLSRATSSIHDAAIAVVVENIHTNVTIELEMAASDEIDDDFLLWRRLIRDAASGRGLCVKGPCDCDSTQVPTTQDPELSNWTTLVDRLADCWLPDRDYELAELFLDADPSQSMVVKEQLGIHNDYFITTVDDPGDGLFEDMLSETRKLVRQKPR